MSSSFNTAARLSRTSLTRHATLTSRTATLYRARYIHRWASGELRTGVVLDQHVAGPVRHSKSRRAFSSTASSRAALAQHPPTKRTVLLAYPSPSSVTEEDEYADVSDIDFVPPEEAQLEITDRAAEVCVALKSLRGASTRELFFGLADELDCLHIRGGAPQWQSA